MHRRLLTSSARDLEGSDPTRLSHGQQLAAQKGSMMYLVIGSIDEMHKNAVPQYDNVHLHGVTIVCCFGTH